MISDWKQRQNRDGHRKGAAKASGPRSPRGPGHRPRGFRFGPNFARRGRTRIARQSKCLLCDRQSGRKNCRIEFEAKSRFYSERDDQKKETIPDEFAALE